MNIAIPQSNTYLYYKITSLTGIIIMNYKLYLLRIALLLLSGIGTYDGISMEQGIKRSLDEEDKSRISSPSKKARYEVHPVSPENQQTAGKDELLAEEPIIQKCDSELLKDFMPIGELGRDEDKMDIAAPSYQDDDHMAPSAFNLHSPAFGSDGNVRYDLVSINPTPLLSSGDSHTNQRFMSPTELLDPKFGLLDLPEEILQNEIFSFFDLYDLGRFEMVSKASMRLCPDSVWKRLGHVIQEDYGFKVELTKELIKGHLIRSMLLTLPDKEATKKALELSQPKFLPNLLSTRPYLFENFLSYKPQYQNHKFFAEVFKEDFFNAYATKFMILIHPEIVKSRLDTHMSLLLNEVILNEGMMLSGSPIRARYKCAYFKELNDFLIERGDEEAMNRQIRNLCIGANGYQRNVNLARELNEQLVGKKNVVAIQRKFRILLTGGTVEYPGLYRRNLKAAKNLLEQLVAMRDKYAIHLKIDAHLQEGFNSNKMLEEMYEKNPQAARELNELLVAAEDKRAMVTKFNGLLHGSRGYEKNPQAAKEFNEQLISIGNEDAIETKFKGLYFGEYGYEKDSKTAINFLEYHMHQEVKGADSRPSWKLTSLFWTPPPLFKREPPHIFRELNDQLIAMGNKKAIKRKFYGLLEGWCGYEKNPQAAIDFNESYVRQGDVKAIKRLLRITTKDIGGSFDRISQYFIYEAWQTNVKIIAPQILQYLCTRYTSESDKDAFYRELSLFVEDYTTRNIRIAHYVKALGLLKGIWGFDKSTQSTKDKSSTSRNNREEAIKYIRRHYIAL